MFSKISQIGKNLTDEISRINDEVNSNRKQGSGSPNAGIDPATASRILSTPTPEPDSMTQPREMSTPEPTNEASTISITVPGTNIKYMDLPPEIRSRMRKFVKYDEKYPILFEAYKAEKRKTVVIQAFEAMLRELTPCSSIGEIDAVRDYIGGLKSKTAFLESELRQAVAKEAESKKSLDELERLRSESRTPDNGELEVLRRQLEELRKQLVDAQAKESQQKEMFDQEKANLEKLLSEKESLIVAKENGLSGFQSEKEKLESQVAELQKSLESSNRLTQLFKEKVAALNEELKSQKESEPANDSAKPNEGSKKGKKKKKGQAAKSPNNDTELIELRHQVEVLEAKAGEAERFEKEAADLAKQVKSQKDEIENQRDMLRDVGDSLVTAKDELKKSQEQYREKTEELEKVKSELESVKADLEVLRIQNSDAVKDYERAKSSLEKKLASLEESHTKGSGEETSAKDAVIESLKKQVEDLKLGFEKNFKDVGEENGQLQKRINDLNKEKAALEKQISELTGLKEREVQLKLDLSSAQSSLTRKDRLLDEKESRLKYLEEEKNKLNDSVIELKVQVSELKTKMNSDLEAKNAALTKNETLRKDYNELMLRLNKVSTENNKLMKNYEEIKDRYEDLQNSKMSTSDEVKTIKRRCEELSMRNREYESRMEVLQEELSEARSMLQERTREAGTIRKLLIETEDTQNTKLKELNARLEKLAEEKEALERESTLSLKKKQRELEDLKSSLESVRDELDLLRRDKASVEAKLSEQESALRDVANSEKQPEENTSERDYKLLESLRDTLQKSEAQIRDLETMNSKLRKANEETSQKLMRLNKKYKLLSQQYRTTRDRRESVASVESDKSSPVVSRSTSVGDLASESQSDTKEKMEYVKNVILGFLEHKEQRGILLPVIKTLLYLNDSDEKRLLSSLP
ncbi:hypothetical protein KL928_000383 [Ogataea angusta]|uniref:GRIP domain-containing protein n=1 Tax=Pichia angusta TaxID=870730 RepID=A0AAN6DJ90_PICAN|nr:uncharacterized protein KL928_000383 [Ogataea angusta]KAG7821908.1 hypothetical protein KL928_000383 [Ogataea angusta]